MPARPLGLGSSIDHRVLSAGTLGSMLGVQLLNKIFLNANVPARGKL